MARLKEQSQRFHRHLQEVKRKTALDPALQWYPWVSLAGFDVLDEMLGGETDALLRMIGNDPVLDVGCGDGDVAFFLESLGARVDVVDHAPTNYNAMYGVRALKRALGSPVGIEACDIDTQPRFPQSHYGFTVMMGILYHLKNPYLALETLARRSNHIFLSTRVAQFAPDRKTQYHGQPVAYLVEEDELNQDATNYWIFTEEALRRIVRRAGWDILHYKTVGAAELSDPVSPQGDARAFVLAKSRIAEAPAGMRLLSGWHHLENGKWRWTERHFSVELQPAEGTLSFTFTLPEAVLAAFPAITLSARAGAQELPPATFTTEGQHTYTARVEAAAGPLVVQFELDHALAPSSADARELGLLVEFFNGPPLAIR